MVIGIPKAGLVKIAIYNLIGQLVTQLLYEYKEAGSYQVTFDAQNVSSGLYFYRIESNGFVDSKKMVVIR
jgi:hypothetical protein